MAENLVSSGALIALAAAFANNAAFRGDCAEQGKRFRNQGELFRGGSQLFRLGDPAKQSTGMPSPGAG
jgi:hypothetical protein